MNQTTDSSPENHEREKAMYFAIEQDKVFIVKKLLDEGYFSANSTVLSTPLLIHAAAAGALEVFNLLLERGAEPHTSPQIPNTHSRTNALVSVCHILPFGAPKLTNRIEIARRLISLNIDVNAFENEDSTALHLATISRCPELMHLLLKAGAHVDASDLCGRTPLLSLIQYQKKEQLEPAPGIVEILLQAGADINARDASGFSPYHACRDEEILALMRRYGTPGPPSEADQKLASLLAFAQKYGIRPDSPRVQRPPIATAIPLEAKEPRTAAPYLAIPVEASAADKQQASAIAAIGSIGRAPTVKESALSEFLNQKLGQRFTAAFPNAKWEIKGDKVCFSHTFKKREDYTFFSKRLNPFLSQTESCQLVLEENANIFSIAITNPDKLLQAVKMSSAEVNLRPSLAP
ncbi:MAG: transient receptor potential channel pyrexia [Gammaproteobacteria bacterium]|jgi:ankyrin repeat protein|nr:transient receptor potential channel pyrexia [Gammaproteobacteria bacterium]